MEYRGIEMVYWFEMGFKKVKNKQLKKQENSIVSALRVTIYRLKLELYGLYMIPFSYVILWFL